jgi:hypothetical protein
LLFSFSPFLLHLPHPRLAQIRAFDQAHAEVVLALVLTNFEDGNDVGMSQTRRRFRFGLETFYQLFGGEGPGTDDLESHQPLQGPLPRLVDGSHTALRDFLQQFVIAKGLAGARRRQHPAQRR